MKIKIVIFNYNTTIMTNNLIKSIIDKIKKIDYKIIIFDNGPVNNKFELDNGIKDCDLEILDNSNNKIIDFNLYYDKYVIKPRCNNACYMHSLSMQYFLDLDESEYIFMHSDTIVKNDFNFIDNRYAVMGQINTGFLKPFNNKFIYRYPYINSSLLYINNKMLNNRARIFDPLRLMQNMDPFISYDTCCSFLEDIIKNHIEFKFIAVNYFIEHFTLQKKY